MEKHPFTTVCRGRVVSITERPHVRGGGMVLGGWGGTRIETVMFTEFWVRSPEFGDCCFKMGTDELPPMLLDHAVTVVLAKSVVCAVVNHSTGVQRCYRPISVYKRNNGGWLFLLLALGILAVLELQGYRAALAGLRGIILVVWIALVGLEQLRVLGYNARLDRSLQTLIALDLPLRGRANVREMDPPRLP